MLFLSNQHLAIVSKYKNQKGLNNEVPLPTVSMGQTDARQHLNQTDKRLFVLLIYLAGIVVHFAVEIVFQ